MITQYQQRAVELEWICGECGTTPAQTYLICTSPRTGSWMLAEGLTDTKLAGNPGEWLNFLEEQRRGGDKMPYQKYLLLACSISHTGNGVSGIKLMYYQAIDLAKRMGGTPDTILRALFPAARCLYLTRTDTTRQAISYVLAAKTDVWWDYGDVGSIKVPAYSAQDIAAAKERLVRQGVYWEQYFARFGIHPLVINYEDDLLADYPGTIRRVLSWLGQDDTVEIVPSRLRQQSNAVNEEWLKRYKEGETWNQL
jgi:LPS sulfotransferase NodH